MTRWEMVLVVSAWSLVGLAGAITLYLAQMVRL